MMHATAFASAPGPSNPFLPLAPVADDATRRAALATLLREIEVAKAAELALAGQVSVAASHQQEAAARLTAASAAVHDAKAAAARITADWLAGDRAGDRPDTTGPVIASQRDKAVAAADAETISGVLEALRRDFEAANLQSKHAQEAAQQAKQRILTAHAVTLAEAINAAEAETVNYRRRLLAFARQTAAMALPAVILGAVHQKSFPDDTYSPMAAADAKRWSDFAAALLVDPEQATFPE